MRGLSLVPKLPPIIEELEAKPGKDWTLEEHAACREWLRSAKWADLLQEIEKVMRESPADHRAGVMATFLNGKLDRILVGYKVGHSGIWPYVVVCLQRHCWEDTLPPIIKELEAKPGKDWTSGERAACRDWLFSSKWAELLQEVEKVIRESPADHRAGVMATFLKDELDRVLVGYKVEYPGIWSHVLKCLRRHCWKAAKSLSLERMLTRSMEESEEGSRVSDKANTALGNPPPSLLEREKWTLLQREFSRLKPDYRKPLLLFIRGATYKEIAAELGVSIELVKIRIFRARQKLGKALSDAWPAHGPEVTE